MQLNLGIALSMSIALSVASQAQAPAARNAAPCEPSAVRGTREFGCFIVASQPAGRFGQFPLFWHVSEFPAPAAANAVKRPRDVVVEAFGKTWLLALGERGWRPRGAATHVAEIGPLPVDAGVDYTAQYIEATLEPGTRSIVHRNAGPETVFTFGGQLCVETPDGRFTARAGGHPVIIPGGPPLQSTATGKEVGRAIFLVLHHANQPPSVPEPEWRPKGLCN